MDNGSKALIGIGCVLLFMFLCMSLSIYQMKRENEKLQLELSRINVRLVQAETSLDVLALDHTVSKIVYAKAIYKNKEKISILDESVHAKDKRWATIKKVRDAIEKTTENQPPILELTQIASSVVDYADMYDVSINLILAVIKRESNYNSRAISHAKANGLMQIMPETGKEIAADIGKRRYSSFNIRDNIRFGTYYLRSMLDRFDGDIGLAVRAYNCGPTYTERVIAGEYQTYPQETIDYLDAVLKWKKEYENLGL